MANGEIVSLYLAANQIQNLPYWAHLQFVALTTSGELWEIEVQAPIGDWSHFFSDWVVFSGDGRIHDDPYNTDYGNNPDAYTRVGLDIGDRVADDVWEIIRDAAISLDNAYLEYSLLSNSNSFVNTILNAIGLNIDDYLPLVTPPAVSSGFPGVHTDVANSPYNPIFERVHYTVAGTDGIDEFHGGRLDDYISGAGGDDRLFDGEDEDTLEGGKGDDTIELTDDGAADIVITGEGDDIVRGGGAEDRLVLRIDILDQMYEDWRAQLEHSNENYGSGYVLAGDALLKPSERIGDDAAISGVPILGGFRDMSYEGVVGTRLTTGQFYASFRAGPESNNLDDWSAASPYFLYTYSYTDDHGNLVSNTNSVLSFSFELKDGDLIVSVPYGPAEDLSVATFEQHLITIEDYEEGDFGIHIYEPSVQIAGGNPWYNEDDDDIPDGYDPFFGTPYVGNASQVAEINNNGDFITILAAIDPASTGGIPQTPPSLLAMMF